MIENEAEVVYIKELIYEGWLDEDTWTRYYSRVPLLIYNDLPLIQRADGGEYAPEEWKTIRQAINNRRIALGCPTEPAGALE